MQRTVKLPAVSGDHFGYSHKTALPVEVEISLTGAAGPEDLTGTRVSITADVWKPNRSDIIAGGQMREELAELYPGNASVARLVELWDRWHLNDMRAGCEHQRANWDTDKKVELWNWDLDFGTEESRRVHDIERAAHKELRETGSATLDPETRAILARPLRRTTSSEERPEGYKPADSKFGPGPHELKHVNWVKPTEHPDGLLGKPCEVCGYRYGTEWRSEEVPPEIVRELAGWVFKS